MARRKKRGTALGSSAKKHQQHADAAFYKAKSFIEAAKLSLSRGACSGALQSAKMAGDYATIAVFEAAHARPARRGGPTASQTDASRMADRATNLWRHVHHQCARTVPIKRHRGPVDE